MKVPCRKCIACRIQITNEWSLRLVHESRCHNENCFITLTYRDDKLPLCRSVCKRTIQLFMKKLRKKVEVKIKYYACGEYGKLHDREHYHLIIFGWQPPIEDLYFAYSKKGKDYYGSRIISALWDRGFNTVGTVTRDSCQYVAGYVRKKDRRIADGKRLPSFNLQSTGIGACYAFAHRERIEKHLSVIEGNKNFGTPRYYSRILGLDNERLKLKREMKDSELYGKYLDDFGLESEAFHKLAVSAQEQREKNLHAQEKIIRSKR